MEVIALGIRGTASVRSCKRSTLNNEIGLEFAAGVRWKKRVTAALESCVLSS
jgi:hypothetical protein